MKNTQTLKTFSNLVNLSNNFTNEEVCRKYLEYIIWNGKPACPFCGCQKYYTFKSSNRYKCANKECYKKYTVTVGTFLESSKLPLRKWFHAIYIFTSHKKGISSHQLAKDLGITQKSAWFVLCRLREVLKEKTPFQLEGITEIDETYVGGKEINKHEKNRLYSEDGNAVENKIAVIGIVTRGQKAALIPVSNVNKKEIFPLIHKHVKKGSVMVTDDLNLYRSLKHNYTHESVNHSLKEYVRGNFHTNSVEGFFSHLKRGLIGIYHHASPKHLHRYCNEFSFRYNTRKCKEVERFDIALKQCTGRLKYKDLISTPDLVSRDKMQG